MKGWNNAAKVISGSSTTPTYPHTTTSIEDQVPMSQNFQAIHAMTDALDYEENETRKATAAEFRCEWEITDTVGVDGQSDFENLCNDKNYDKTYAMYLIYMLKISRMSGFQLNSVFSKRKGPSVLLFGISTRCFLNSCPASASCSVSSNWKPLRGGA